VGVINNAGSVWLGRLDVNPVAGQYLSVIWEATETNNRIAISSFSTVFQCDFDDADVHEVTPGCIAADALACDGWFKKSGMSLYREHDGTNTKAGSFYALKVVTGSTSDYLIGNGLIRNVDSYYKKFAGRTVAFGCWVKTDTANCIRLTLFDGAWTYSSYHTGGNAYEWLEVTAVISATPSQFNAQIDLLVSGKTAYFSQPMLVFGSSIGVGNYQPIMNEVIRFESYKLSNLLNNKIGKSTEGWLPINLEADSNGGIPKGAKEVDIRALVNDSGSAGVTQAYIMFAGDNVYANSHLDLTGLYADTVVERVMTSSCTAVGDLQYAIAATGAGTFDCNSIRYVGVKL
jgi:hypothetical protein